MIKTVKKWLRDHFSKADPSPLNLRATGINAKPRPHSTKPEEPDYSPDFVEADVEFRGHVETIGPGKNVLIRNRFVREDSGTHETLKIVDDSIVDSGEKGGLDPYNTGVFDRSKNWDQRSRK